MKALSLLAAVAVSAGAAWAGVPSADVKMQCVDGKERSIADVKGAKGTLVIFSCLHCPYAKAWDARIVKLSNACQKDGIGVIMINPNDPKVAGDTFEAMQKHAKAAGYEFPYAVDATSDIARAFKAGKTPQVFLYDKDGNLVYTGAVDDNSKAGKEKEHYLKDAIDALLAGKEPKVKETKAVGCSIKFRPKK
jgi:thioredoxin-related protein